jgi:CubicO group peptidase (beta-lactamase class C family)
MQPLLFRKATWRGAWLAVPVLVMLAGSLAAQVASPRITEVGTNWASGVIERYAAALRADVAADGLGGITAGVAVGRDVVWVEGFGWADRARAIPAADHTVYRIGSVSKTITAALMMRLVDHGVVRLEDSVVHSLPEFALIEGDSAMARGITLRQLASHTGGLIREPQLEGAAAGPLRDWEAKVLASIPTTAIQHPPGSRYAYSNIGYGILGLTLSRAAGRDFMDLVREQVFGPLDMRHSGFVVTPSMRAALATGYANGRAGTIDSMAPAREHHGRGYKVPNGGVYSTVGDLANFFAGLMGAWPVPFLSTASRHGMLALQTPGDSTRGYGLGLFVRRLDNGARTIGHSGSVAGYNVHAIFDPDAQIGVILLRNYNRGRTNLGGVAAAWLGDLVTAHQTTHR